MKRLIINEPDNTFFTSDLHLGHENILKYCDRPFKDVNHMDRELIGNWNATVNDESLIFILGDFCWGRKKAIWEEYLSQLRGKKILIPGNHDDDRDIPHLLFEEVYQGYINIDVIENSKHQLITLCHFPMLSWEYSHKGAWNLFGHWHSSTVHKPEGHGPDDLEVAEYVANEELAYHKLRPTQYDVGIDGNHYHPASYHKVKKIIEMQSLKYKNEKKT